MPTSTLPVTPADSDAITPSSTLQPVRSMATDPISQALFAVLATGITLGYTVTLPFASTQRLTTRNWQFLTGRLLGFAIALGIGMALVLTVQVYALRRSAAVRRAAAGGAVSGVAMAVSLLPTFLCCTPIIPTLLATVGLSTVSVYSTTGSLQHFFAMHQTAFFLASLALLVTTGWWSVRRLAAAVCLTDTGCAVPSTPGLGR